jgi:hypothetical protein
VIPERIQAFMDEISLDTGLTPTCEQLGLDKWRITLVHAAVVLTVDYRRFKRGRFRQIATSLTVAGQRQPPRSYEDCVLMFNPSAFPLQSVTEMPLAEPADAPPIIRKVYTDLKSNEIIEVSLHYQDTCWAVRMHDPERAMVMTRYLTERIDNCDLTVQTFYRQQREFELFVDGEDKTDDYDRNQLLRMMAPYAGKPATKFAQTKSQAAAKRNGPAGPTIERSITIRMRS